MEMWCKWFLLTSFRMEPLPALHESTHQETGLVLGCSLNLLGPTWEASKEVQARAQESDLGPWGSLGLAWKVVPS